MVSTSAGQTNVPRLIVTDPAEHSGLVLALTGTEMVIGHSDTADLILGPNLYAYCRDNPVIMHDPTGTQGTPGQDADDGPHFHFVVIEPKPGAKPAPSVHLVYERPKFRPLGVVPDPPPDKSKPEPAPEPPPKPPGEPQPINPLQLFAPAPTSDPGFKNIAASVGYSSVGTGASSLGYAASRGFHHEGEWAAEAVANVSGTGSPDGTLTAGQVSVGAHVTLNPKDSRQNYTGYATLGQTYGQNPPGTGAFNPGFGLTLGYEHHFGGTNQSPLLVLGGNAAFGIGQYAGITPAAPPAGSTPTGFMTPALSIAGVANLALNLGYYSKDSQIPHVTAFLEGFGGYAGGASRLTLPGGGLSQSGGTTTAGGNLGFLYNFRFEDKRSVSVLSLGATVGLRYQADTVGSRTFPATGGFFGLVAGAAF